MMIGTGSGLGVGMKRMSKKGDSRLRREHGLSGLDYWLDGNGAETSLQVANVVVDCRLSHEAVDEAASANVYSLKFGKRNRDSSFKNCNNDLILI